MHNFHRHDFAYRRLSHRRQPPPALDRAMMHVSEPERVRLPPIDLRKVPSHMEQLAESWRRG